MNAFVEHMMFRKTLALLVFSMVFLLTPRAWVDQGSVSSYHPSGSPAETIPVNLLERQDDTCLWCAPLQPVKCDDTKAPAEGAPSHDRLWLNPDEPPESESAAPCAKPLVPEQEPSPSA